MFISYYSNRLEDQINALALLLKQIPLDDPLQTEVILVQSPGMAQWVQMELAKRHQVSANFDFPMPASYLWRLYAQNLPYIGSEDPFNKNIMVWHLMELIPQFLPQPEFSPLAKYLKSAPFSAQQKLYQLCVKIADLFDQYLVYRAEWIKHWEHSQDHLIQHDLARSFPQADLLFQQLCQHIKWQGILWRALVARIQQKTSSTTHRAKLLAQFLAKLHGGEVINLPERLFVFGISALPQAYLQILQAISQHCDVHLFFNNPCQHYWGDIKDLSRAYLFSYQRKNNNAQPLLSDKQKQQLQKNDIEQSYYAEELIRGNPLLSSWGKMGRDFLYQLIQGEENVSSISLDLHNQQDFPDSLLGRLQAQILTLSNQSLGLPDDSIQFSSCHSPMREVEVLQDYLLHLFNQNVNKSAEQQITPKDIVVMVTDINQYTPYIQAVFNQQQNGVPTIPFSISDNLLSESNLLVANFLQLLSLKESLFSAEQVLELLDIEPLRQSFNIELDDLQQIRHWVKDSGIRFGLSKQDTEKNYNSWQAGLEKMLLGFALREENGIWQDGIGLDSSYGLKGLLVGKLASFLERLYQWQQCLQGEYDIQQWHKLLSQLLQDFFIFNEQTQQTLFYIQDCLDSLLQQLQNIEFNQPLQAEIIYEVLTKQLNETPTSLKFLAGKVNFCTLLPMRAIPFKVVCLLGMNEGDYPRQQMPNSFDLMQYHKLRGDRLRRDDDRYLFLEALLAARQQLYISYVGNSLVDNSPREPSVLVTQLMEYLNQHLDKPILPQSQAMTVFSPNNFNGEQLSFAGKWLSLHSAQKKPLQDFAQVLQNPPPTVSVQHIELTALIEFISHPIKFFFEKQLGVYLKEENEHILDSENFTLEALDAYNIKQELLYLESEQIEPYFERLKVKGLLPRGNFAYTEIASLKQDVARFKAKIQDFTQPISENLNLNFELDNGTKVHLFGYVDNLFGDHKQHICLKFAKMKDHYRIAPWINYLMQLATAKNEEQIAVAKLFSQDKDISLPVVNQQKALELLKIYVSAYLQSQQQIQLVPTKNINKFIAQGEINYAELAYALTDLTSTHPHQLPDPYWKRLLAQSSLIDDEQRLQHLVQQTTLWFADMMKK